MNSQLSGKLSNVLVRRVSRHRNLAILFRANQDRRDNLRSAGALGTTISASMALDARPLARATLVAPSTDPSSAQVLAAAANSVATLPGGEPTSPHPVVSTPPERVAHQSPLSSQPLRAERGPVRLAAAPTYQAGSEQKMATKSTIQATSQPMPSSATSATTAGQAMDTAPAPSKPMDQDREWRRLQTILRRHEEKQPPAATGQTPGSTTPVQRQPAASSTQVSQEQETQKPTMAFEVLPAMPGKPVAEDNPPLAAPAPTQAAQRRQEATPSETTVASSGGQLLRPAAQTTDVATLQRANLPPELQLRQPATLPPEVIQGRIEDAAPDAAPMRQVTYLTAQRGQATAPDITPGHLNVAPTQAAASPALADQASTNAATMPGALPPVVALPSVQALQREQVETQLHAHVQAEEVIGVAEPSRHEFNPSLVDAEDAESFLMDEAGEEAEPPLSQPVLQSVPLEAAWPVERHGRLPADTGLGPPTLLEATSNRLSQPLAHEQAHTDTIRTVLQRVASGQPTASSIELIGPRRPRPLGASVTALPQVTQVGDMATSEQTLPPPMPQPSPSQLGQASHSKDTLVQTQIGPLPADLWSLLGQPLPAAGEQPLTPVAPEAIQHALSQPIASAATASAPASAPRSTLSSPSADRSVSIQRAPLPADESGTAQGEARAFVVAEGEREGPVNPSNAELDIEELTRQVYREIRRRLAVEGERLRFVP